MAANGGSTKRFVLHVLGGIFDPIGFLGPFIMKLKIFIKNCGLKKIDWNSELPPLLDYKWQLWCSEIEQLNDKFIPRHYLSGLNSCDFISFDIHSFSDASMKAYGCVVYLRETTGENRIQPYACFGYGWGISASDLAQNSLWWHGPPWLNQPSEYWPNKVENEKPTGDLEIRSEVEIISQCKCAVYDSEFVLDLNKYSDLSSVENYSFEAELNWIKYEQNLVYCSELECIKNGKQISKKSSLYYFAPFFNKLRVLRVRGRLEESDLSDNKIHPILLPKQSKFTDFLISREHKKVCHGRVFAALAKIRSAFWIPRGRQIEKGFENLSHLQEILIETYCTINAQLPKSRVLEKHPFTVTGIDFTDPVSIRSGKDANQKSYITLFTCAVTRALHIELVTDITTKNFILS
ncbi:hypothetical protein HNY73_005854 [Argiope bruennichi]|uniref:Uncharacterized protein n=1 Tax=Argiope bruennichi TaxID=94029 RepID=A0A8T0FL17_ARGBR|nr:hypothetical protein HNY73_005854 [Argiope bruennichi]